MSTATELLRRAQEFLKYPLLHGSNNLIWPRQDLFQDIENFLAAEPEAETIETLRAENFKLAAGQCTEGGPWGDEGGTPYCKYAEPAARKPMTEEEIDEVIGSIGNLCVFRAGIRFAEKHHGIGGDDDKQG